MKKLAAQKQEWLTIGHGEYSELSNEKEFFEACKKSQNFICHFYRQSTFRCKIVDKHLGILAKKHVEARFCKIDAEKSPFLTQRLHIRMLPTIVLCKDAKKIDSIIGFDDLGGIDEFSTEMMEWRIAQAKVINYAGDLLHPPGSAAANRQKTNILGYNKPKTIRGGGAGDYDDDSD